MRRIIVLALLVVANGYAKDTALTLYNQNFAVVRDRIVLDLKEGETRLEFSEITAYAEPDSVILRDLSGKNNLRILEQNYRADPVSQDLLLSHFEGQEIEFLSNTNIVKGTIVRGGNLGTITYSYSQQAIREDPIIEVDGQLRFSLPGQPLFPSLGDDSILKPTFNWLLHSELSGKADAELCYVSGGLNWEADYNIVAPEKGNRVDLIGWVTMENNSGRTFEDARIKLMAGDVEKIQPTSKMMLRKPKLAMRSMGYSSSEPAVTEKTFDEYHLYELQRTTTLRNKETKQVEFLRATGVDSQTVYIYDGVKIDHNRYRGYSYDSLRNNREYGTDCSTKVGTLREFKNTKANGLGIPLPKGRTRFYRRDTDGQLEFTGENVIDHTPKDETISIFTGNAFDLIGERIRTDYQINTSENWIDESFEIKLRNRKENETVEIRIVEHLYRALSWTIVEQSDIHLKTDAKTMELRVQVAPGEEKIITYKVHYTW